MTTTVAVLIFITYSFYDEIKGIFICKKEPLIHQTVVKKITNSPCPSSKANDADNIAQGCLDTIYPQTDIWQFL